MNGRHVLSRHRLPPRYRVGLTVMWVAPLLIFVAAIVSQQGIIPALLDPRFVLPALLMIAPSVYFWREGVDVLPDGITRYIHLPHSYHFDELDRLDYDARADRHVLTVWDRHGAKILECRAGHLTDFPTLLEILTERVNQ